MRAVRRFAPLFIAWAFISLMFWGWIFGFLTDAPAANKLTLYADAEVPGAVQMAVLLEEGAGSGIRMAPVHPFTYAMMVCARRTSISSPSTMWRPTGTGLPRCPTNWPRSRKHSLPVMRRWACWPGIPTPGGVSPRSGSPTRRSAAGFSSAAKACTPVPGTPKPSMPSGGSTNAFRRIEPA